MDWFKGGSEVGGDRRSSSHHHHHHKSSSSGHHDSSRHESSHHDAARSIFGSGSPKHNSSRSSFFGGWIPNQRSSTSRYGRSSRPGFIKRQFATLRHLLRKLLYYIKHNPLKVFMLVIMPLITGGALTGLLSKFGIRLPAGVEKLFGAAGGRGAGGGYGGGGMSYEHSKVEGPLEALGGLGSIAAGMGGIGGAVNLAKMFM